MCDINIALIGKKQTGKSCMIHSLINNKYERISSPTIATVCYSKDIVIDGQQIKLRILDNSGSHNYISIIKSSFLNADGFMLVFDVTNRESFNEIDFWLDEVKCSNIPHQFELVIVGNKCDDENVREVSEEEARNFALKNNLHYFEVSARDMSGLDDAFSYITTQIYHFLKNKRKTKCMKQLYT